MYHLLQQIKINRTKLKITNSQIQFLSPVYVKSLKVLRKTKAKLKVRLIFFKATKKLDKMNIPRYLKLGQFSNCDSFLNKDVF